MSVTRIFFSTVESAPPSVSEARASADRELSEQESAEAFKIIVTLREAIEAADSVERRIEGTSDRRYRRRAIGISRLRKLRGGCSSK
jgi:hypothetical protein